MSGYSFIRKFKKVKSKWETQIVLIIEGIPNPIIKFRPKVLLSIKMGLNIIVVIKRYFCVCYFFSRYFEKNLRVLPVYELSNTKGIKSESYAMRLKVFVPPFPFCF